MKLKCEHCHLEFELPGDDWTETVSCPKCRHQISLQNAQTVQYGGTDLLELSPPGGERRPEVLGEEETLPDGSLIGQYKIVGFLGRGGMGAVYRAKHTMLQRDVALKILPAKFAKDQEFVQRFHREAMALANLSHPNIVAIHDMGVQGDIYFIIMELVDGVSMRDVLAKRKLSASDALKVVPQLCEALEYAHKKGVIHRDIKPENILLDKSGHPKIADFGLAKIMKGETTAYVPLTKTNVVMGTVEYMAPEQRHADKGVDHRADIYSLGVLLYEMLTGELPVGKFEMPSERLKIDVTIDGVVLKALEKNPERRYQRASQMGVAISEVSETPRGPMPILDLSSHKTLATIQDNRVQLRTGDAALDITGWHKAQVGVEAEGTYLVENSVIQATAETQSLRVFLPPGLQLDVIAADAEVAIRNTAGTATVRTRDESLLIDGHTGPLKITMQDGDLDASRVTSPEFDVQLRDGSVELRELRLLQGKANVEAQSGDISVALTNDSSVRYTLQTVSGDISCPLQAKSGSTVAGTYGEGVANLYVRTSSGDIDLRAGDGQNITLGSLADIPKKLTAKQKEKIGIYVIVNLALFLFFGLVAGNLIAPIIISIFWGMGLALDVWKTHVRGKGQSLSPKRKSTVAVAATPPVPIGPRMSWLAIGGFLLAVCSSLVALGLGITYVIERRGGELEIPLHEIQGLRIGVIATAYATVLIGALAFFLCVAASGHVRRARGMLKGRFWSGSGMLLALAPCIFVFAVVLPRYNRLHKQTLRVRVVAEDFSRKVEEGKVDEAYKMLTRETKEGLSLDKFRAQCTRIREDWKNARASEVVVDSIMTRAEFRYRSKTRRLGRPLRIRAIREAGEWRIVDPFSKQLEGTPGAVIRKLGDCLQRKDYKTLRKYATESQLSALKKRMGTEDADVLPKALLSVPDVGNPINWNTSLQVTWSVDGTYSNAKLAYVRNSWQLIEFDFNRSYRSSETGTASVATPGDVLRGLLNALEMKQYKEAHQFLAKKLRDKYEPARLRTLRRGDHALAEFPEIGRTAVGVDWFAIEIVHNRNRRTPKQSVQFIRESGEWRIAEISLGRRGGTWK